MFSIVIPLYNKELSIKSTIQSVLEQTFEDFEIVVVNDGSVDSSVSKVEEISDPRIRLIHQRNQGVSVARNRGILEAKHEWIAFLDADDEWYKDKLQLFSAHIRKYPYVNWGFSGYEQIENGKIKRKYTHNNKIPVLENVFESLLEGIKLQTSCIVVKKEFIITHNIFFRVGLNHSEDLEAWYKFCIYDKNPLYIKQCISRYIDHPDQGALTKIDPKTSEFHFLSILDRLQKDIKKLDSKDRRTFIKFHTFHQKRLIYYYWSVLRNVPERFESYLCKPEYNILKMLVWLPHKIKAIIRKVTIVIIYPFHVY